MTYRFLPKEEWGRLQFIFDEFGGRIPEDGRIVIAEDRQEVVGMLVLQLVAHAEPLWIDKLYRGRVSWKRMLAMLDSLFQSSGSYFVFAPDEHIARMASLARMNEKHWKVWERKVN